MLAEPKQTSSTNPRSGTSKSRANVFKYLAMFLAATTEPPMLLTLTATTAGL